jgi:hypothetical protein
MCEYRQSSYKLRQVKNWDSLRGTPLSQGIVSRYAQINRLSHDCHTISFELSQKDGIREQHLRTNL